MNQGKGWVKGVLTGSQGGNRDSTPLERGLRGRCRTPLQPLPQGHESWPSSAHTSPSSFEGSSQGRQLNVNTSDEPAITSQKVLSREERVSAGGSCGENGMARAPSRSAGVTHTCHGAMTCTLPGGSHLVVYGRALRADSLRPITFALLPM